MTATSILRLGQCVAPVCGPIAGGAAVGDALALADAAVDATVGRLYSTILRLEAEGMSRRIHTSIAHAYPVGGAKPLGTGGRVMSAVERGETFVTACPAAIAQHYPDHMTVAALGATCLVNAPILAADGRTLGLLNVASARSYAPAEIAVIGLVGAMLGPAMPILRS